MTVALAYSPASRNGNGVTTAFPTTWMFLAAADLIVKTTTAGVTTTKVLDVDYTVAGAGNPEPGGTVNFIAAPAIGTVVTIFRQTPIVQPVLLQQSGRFPPASVMQEFDRLTLIAQEQAYAIEQLQALGNLVNITGANAVSVEVDVTTEDNVEDTFPITVAVPGGESALGLTVLVEDSGDDADLANRAPAAQWAPGPEANTITLLFISDLKPDNAYTVSLLVFV